MLKRGFKSVSRCLQHFDDDLLAKYYPPELLKSIKCAQTAIPRDTRFRVSHNVEFASAYYDDFSKIDSYWDYKPGMPQLHAQPEELLQNPIYDWSQVQQPLPGGRVMPPGTSLPTARGRTSKTLDVATGLNRQTGVDVEYITKKLIMKPLVMKRVSNQTAKGKIPSFYALVVVGDRNGMVGLGEGKSREEMSKAISKAHWDAIRNLKEIPRYENRTIYSDIDYRYHGVKLHLRSAKPGFGLRVNHVIFEICECAGIKDLSGKVYKSRNEMNIAKGTLEAFTNAQRTLDEIALGRGKRIADVRNVYYSG
ncbi:probable 37S ribosomal protein S5, mitochondrial [Zygosaccharomyces bailii ISA1307]|nr:probable 37S ribosomal protein S5, mitochondrial [Zygosaccharomyces bailii ISA1307]